MAKDDNDDARKFTELKELLEIIKNKIEMMDVLQTGQSATVRLIKDQLSVINSKLDSHTASLITIETERKMEKRLIALEGKEKIKVPSELQLMDVQ